MEEVTIGDCRLILGDTLEQMAMLPDGSVDMILADLPYGILKTCKWDAIIPFDKLWKQYKRIIKFNGAIVLFGSEPFSSNMRMSNLDMFKYDLIWEKNKPTNIFQLRHCFGRTHENISIFSFADVTYHSKNKMIYNPQGVQDTDKLGKTYMKDESVHGLKKTERYKMHGANYPRSVLKFDGDNNKVHPSQKPVLLCEYLIKTYTNEDETVLDNTMGSGTCGVACVNTKRHFIGIERDDNYFAIATKRIEEATNPKQASMI